MDESAETEVRQEISSLLSKVVDVNEGRAESREVGWRIFDLVTSESDLSKASFLAEQLCAEVGRVRGVTSASLDVYRQRGRDMVRFRSEIAASPRSLSPLTLAKKLRAQVARHGQEPDLNLINAILSSNEATREAVIELVASGRLRRADAERA
jgi:hypothetical protein